MAIKLLINHQPSLSWYWQWLTNWLTILTDRQLTDWLTIEWLTIDWLTIDWLTIKLLIKDHILSPDIDNDWPMLIYWLTKYWLTDNWLTDWVLIDWLLTDWLLTDWPLSIWTISTLIDQYWPWLTNIDPNRLILTMTDRGMRQERRWIKQCVSTGFGA